MSEEEKKAAMLLKSLIFHYHGLDEDEKKILEKASKKLGAKKELLWANGFIAEDYLSAFERAREFLRKIILRLDKEERLNQLFETWEENYEKGYVTEMETTAMLMLSKDWDIENEFMTKIRS